MEGATPSVHYGCVAPRSGAARIVILRVPERALFAGAQGAVKIIVLALPSSLTLCSPPAAIGPQKMLLRLC